MSAVGDDFYQEVMTGIGAGWSENIAALCHDWQRHEGGNADWNPWNTTQPEHGAKDYNSAHVKIYPDRETGIKATIRTLKNGHYPAIVDAFANDLPEAEWGKHDDILSQLGVWGTANWASELRRKAGGGGGEPHHDPHPSHQDGMLRSGSHGAEVKQWQGELNQADNAGLTEDGDFGPATEHATKAFQQKHGLHADGVVGPQTQAAMQQALAGGSSDGGGSDDGGGQPSDYNPLGLGTLGYGGYGGASDDSGNGGSSDQAYGDSTDQSSYAAGTGDSGYGSSYDQSSYGGDQSYDYGSDESSQGGDQSYDYGSGQLAHAGSADNSGYAGDQSSADLSGHSYDYSSDQASDDAGDHAYAYSGDQSSDGGDAGDTGY